MGRTMRTKTCPPPPRRLPEEARALGTSRSKSDPAGLDARNEECHGVLDRAEVRETSQSGWHISRATGEGAQAPKQQI